MNAIYLYRIGNFFFKHKLKFIAKFFVVLSYFIYNSYIPASCKIGKGTKFAYWGIGVVIHANAEIGSNCLIGQNITIGGRNGVMQVPHIKDNVYLGAGARIIGDIEIGHDTIIAPNAVIIKNVEPYSVIAGIPGRKISNITKKNFEEKYQFYYGPSSYMKE